jgi:hypothetical protein
MVLYSLLMIGGVVGLILMYRGFRLRWVGDAPFCAACGYNLTGSESERCPECGADRNQPYAVVVGEPMRQTRLGFVGSILVALPVFMMILSLVGNWNVRMMPDIWLAADCGSTDSRVAVPAWWEVDARLSKGTFSPWAKQRLREITLDVQERIRRHGRLHKAEIGLMDFLAQEYVKASLTPEQRNRYVSQMFELSLDVRPKARAGDEFPVTLQCERWGGPAIFRVETQSFSIADREIGEGFDVGYVVQYSAGKRGPVKQFRFDQVGLHPVTMTVKVSLYPAMPNRISTSFPGTWIDQTYGPPSDTFQVILRDEIEIVDPRSESDVVLVSRPDEIRALEQEINSLRDGNHVFKATGRTCAATPHETEWTREGASGVSIDVALSSNIAARMIMEIDGRRVDIGTAVAKRDENFFHLRFDKFCFDASRTGVSERVDLRLIADKDVARELTDVYEIYEGEIVITDVLIEWQAD